jgi:hypothetical protein
VAIKHLLALDQFEEEKVDYLYTSIIKSVSAVNKRDGKYGMKNRGDRIWKVRAFHVSIR